MKSRLMRGETVFRKTVSYFTGEFFTVIEVLPKRKVYLSSNAIYEGIFQESELIRLGSDYEILEYGVAKRQGDSKLTKNGWRKCSYSTYVMSWEIVRRRKE